MARKTLPLFLRVYGERSNGVWSLICLDFTLAVQAESLQEAKLKLQQMVKSNKTDALAEDGQDHEFAVAFLRRKAPVAFWVKYYWYSFLAKIRGNSGQDDTDHVADSAPIPMVPAGA
ncbi:MAG: hypothetical protein R6V42_01440 [Orrella sp.]